jgi:MFS family permease
VGGVRRFALACAVAVTATLTSAPLSLLLPALTLAGGLALGWNALLLTAAAEFAGLRRAGAALGLQQTGLAVWATCVAPAFAFLVDRTSWRLSFLLISVVAGSAYPLLCRLDTDPVAC